MDPAEIAKNDAAAAAQIEAENEKAKSIASMKIALFKASSEEAEPPK